MGVKWSKRDLTEREIWDAEDRHYEAVTLLSHFCPTCNTDCGEPDFEPSDPSVGIFGVVWSNECVEHGVFTTSDIGEQEFES